MHRFLIDASQRAHIHPAVDRAAFVRDAQRHLAQAHAFPTSADAPPNERHAQARAQAGTELERAQVEVALEYRRQFEQALRMAVKAAGM